MPKPVENTAEIRSQNKKRIIQYVAHHPNQTRKQISDDLGLSFATISNLCVQMISDGILRSESAERPPVGRNPGLVALNPTACCTLCVDLSDENTTPLALINLCGEAVAAKTLEGTADCDYEALLARVHDTAQELLNSVGIAMDNLIGVGVSAPGILNLQTDLFINATYSKLEGRALRADFERLFAPLPCCVGNEANLTALAIQRFNGGEALSDLIYLYVDEGLGIGAVTGGRLLSGAHGLGGEINHWRLAGGRNYPCYCGQNGCLETELSLSGFLQKYADDTPNHESINWDAFVSRVQSGDATALSIVRESGQLVGRVLSSLQMLLDPAACWIGGRVTDIFDELLPAIESSLSRDDGHTPCMPVHPARDGRSLSLIGAASLVFDEWRA